MTTYHKKKMLKTAPDVTTIILTHNFIDSISFYSIFSSKWKTQSTTINFLD